MVPIRLIRFAPFAICMKNFTDVGVEIQGTNWYILVSRGKQIGTFGQNIYHCQNIVTKPNT